MNDGRSWRFSHAVSRLPGASIAKGLRAGTGVDPDPEEFLSEHRAYTDALAATGAKVTVLDAIEAYPDSVFVEDAALCAAGSAIILRPGAESRFGEAGAIAPALEAIFGQVTRLERGFADGGDILLTDDEALVGMSERTDQEGVDALSDILAPLGYRVRVVRTPPGVLHFKSDCGLLDSTTIFSTERLAGSGCFEGYRVIKAPQGEEAAANLIRFNGPVFLRTGFPKTHALLQSEGYEVAVLSADQAALVDGGLSCMSLRFSL